MSLYIDHQYIQSVGSRLERFKRKNERLYNFRCPFCGDSSRSKIKARGYFFRKGNDMYFCCHNCLKNWTLGHFLKEFDFSVYEQYVFDRYKAGDNGHSNVQKPEFNFKFNKPGDIKAPPVKDDVLAEYTVIDELDNSHYAKLYVAKRRIPKAFWETLYFVPDFKKLIDKLEPTNVYGLQPHDARLIIPFRDKFGNIIAVQGRSFSDSGLRYITIKIDKDAPKIYGLDRVNADKQVYVLEGPIDSMFLPNAIATAGAKLGTSDLACVPNRVFVFDNERRKKEIVDAMVKMADKDESVVVWPDEVKEKDINAMILKGRGSKEVIDIIKANTHKGLSARIAISEWRRC